MEIGRIDTEDDPRRFSKLLGRLSRISFLLPMIVVVAVILTAAAVGTYAYYQASRHVEEQANNHLVALREARHAELQRYVRSIEEDLTLIAGSPEVATGLTNFRRAFAKMNLARRYEEESALRRVFSPERPAGNRDELQGGDSEGVWRYYGIHNRHHGWFNLQTELKGYRDIYLITPVGDVVYSASKRSDFATNLLQGTFSSSGLADAFRAASLNSDQNQITFVDYTLYEPMDDQPAAFIARKIVHHGRTIGVLALQLPIERINDVLRTTSGMGDSGETYVVGPDMLMRSDSRFLDGSTILATNVPTEAIAAALQGQKDVRTVNGYRGVPVVSAYMPFEIFGQPWALVAEMAATEVTASIEEMRRSILQIAAVLAITVAIWGIAVTGKITRPLARLSDAINEFRLTLTAPDLPQTARHDEIGDIARGFEIAAQEIGEYIDEINDARAELKRGADELVEREERIRSLLEVSPIGFTLSRLDGEIIMTNPALRRILRHPKGTDTSFEAWEIYRHEADRQRHVELLQQDGAVSGFECQMRTADGADIWATVSSKIVDYKGEPAILAWTDDITDRKQAEADLRRSEETFRTVIDQLPGALGLKGADDRYILVNLQWKSWYAEPDRPIVGSSTHEYHTKEVADDILAAENQIKETGTPIVREMSFAFRDGIERTLHMTKFPIFAEDGSVFAVASIDFDITELKRAEAEAARQRDIVEKTLHNMDQGILMADAEMKLLAFNERLAELSGFPFDVLRNSETFGSLMETFLRDCLQLEDWEQQLAHSMETARKTEFTSYETSFANDRIVEVRHNPLSAGGFVRTFADITERKQAEKKLEDAFEIISDSIQYASRIQQAILPDTDFMSAVVDDYFILWEPRDVVGGDIYWVGAWGDGCLVMLGDCTGHGVPGAFMTLIAIGALERALQEIEGGQVEKLITRTHQFIQLTLGQHVGDGDPGDGIELGACYFVPDEPNMTFAGARFDLLMCDGTTVETIKGTKSGMGYRGVDYTQGYVEHTVDVSPGSSFYMTSDGLIDQIGGERRRMFGKKRLRELLVANNDRPMAEQSEILRQALLDYQGAEIRRDDVAVIGFKL